MDSFVTFEGPGPFHLPTAQRATATGHQNNGVTITLYCLLSEEQNGVVVARRSEPEAVGVQMISRVARELAVRLLQAADEADRKS